MRAADGVARHVVDLHEDPDRRPAAVALTERVDTGTEAARRGLRGRARARERAELDQAGRDVVEPAGRDVDDANAEVLKPLRYAGRRTRLPDHCDRRCERHDALVIEAEGVADL